MNILPIPGAAAGKPDHRHSSAPPSRFGISALMVALVLGTTGITIPARAQFAITEFMAANRASLNDEDGENSDWIEIQNQGVSSANLAGWFLTDTTNNLAKWQFPATNLPPNAYLIVFASEKNRRTPGAPLHTNFRLALGGEFLALVAPDGTNIVSQFAPAFPPQLDDVSYGVVRNATTVTLLGPGAPARAFVPPNDNLVLTWTSVEFDDSTWTNGTTGIGYDRQAAGVNFLPLIGLNVEAMLYPNNASLYARVPFIAANPGDLSGLTLRMKFEDGFIAYLNGQEIARSNAPAVAAFNSAAIGPRTDTAATNFLDFDVSQFRGFLVAGANILAFHALNNPTNSPDLLLLPQLDGLTLNGPPVARYFPVPTPGRANNAGVDAVGPIISSEQHAPAEPADADNLIVTARIRPAFAPVASATLRYRVMFGSEVSVPFLDNGGSGDGLAGDGVFGASIPASASTPGQMVRWYITATDTTGTNISRYPAYQNTNESAAYCGTVVANPTLTNALPVFHWFVQNVAATDTTTGTRASVYWNGEFIDNVFCRVRGASAPSFPKKPYKFDFNPGEHFRFAPGQPRVEELNLNTTFQNKAYVNAPFSFETYQNAGVPASDAFNVRVQQNNAFFSIATFVEQVDEDFLERRGLDPAGALYKIFNFLDSSTSGVEKKTRRTENNSDLQALVAGVSPSNPNRGAALFDLLDVPEVINYLAAGVVAQDWDRVVKNIYVYRDTLGTGLWQMFPWDKDLSFGKVGLVDDGVTGNRDSTGQGSGEPYLSHPFYGMVGRNCCGPNYLFDAVYTSPATRELFLRRLRTLMDELLQPPGTPTNQLRYEARLDALYPLLANDSVLDRNRWGAGYGTNHPLSTAFAILKRDYFAPRRTHLYQTHNVNNVGVYPLAVGIPNAQLGSPALTFGTIEFNPTSSNQAQEYIELRNPNPVAVDISGWRLEDGVDFTFAPGTVVGANGRIYVSPNVVGFRTRTTGPRSGQSLLVVGNYSGQLSARGELLTLRDAAGTILATNRYAGSPSLAQQFLRITELMYHPSPLVGNTNAPDAFEFIELKNVSTSVTLDLRGVRFTNGVEFGFTGSALTSLAPGASVLVVRSLAAFAARYGAGLPVAGQFLGALENEGERIQLLDASGEEILDFNYDDDWYPVTDGLGFSLVAVNELAEPDAWNSASNWRPSGTLNGSPAVTEPAPPALAPIVINEVLSRTDLPPPTDSIELFNPTTNAVNIGGWFLTDDFNTPKKFRIPGGTLISAGGHRIFTEADFNPGGLGFAFSSLGDEAWLFSGDAQTNLTGYVHGFRFGAAENGVSFGRHVTSEGEEHFVAQSAQTLDGANAGPRVGPVVLSEIHYHPSDSVAAGMTKPSALDVLLGRQSEAVAATADELEFVELQNITASAVPLFDPLNPTNTWRLRGDADFDFPTNVTLSPGATLLVVNFNPVSNTNALAVFRTAYGLEASVPLFGPYSGSLDNSSARVELQKPDAPNAGTVPRIVVDTVQYRDTAPWPAAADGAGSSLQRLVASAYGNEPTNWFAAGLSPGSSNVLNLAPTITILSPTNGATFGQPVNIPITTDADDSDGTIRKVEFFAGNVKLGEVTDAPFNFTWSNASFGIHLLTARATDNRLGVTVSSPVSITVLAQPPTVSITSPTNGAQLLAGSGNTIVAAAGDVDGFIAKVEFYAGVTKLGTATVAPYALIWTNALPGNYALTALATDNGGFTAISAPVNVSVVNGSTASVTMVSTGAVWKYFDLGTDLGTAWRAAGFNDATWASGPAPLGYGDGDEATTNSFGPDANNKFITSYYRRAFNVAGASAFSALNLRVLRDDGVVVYLNGAELFRNGMPEGPIAFNTLANITVVGGDESTNFFGGPVNPALLVEGVNVLAVEIHQVLPSSSDISFDLELSGTQTFLAPAITTQPVTQTAPVGSTVAFSVAASGTPPLTYQWRWNGTNLAGANSATLTLPDVQLAQSGAYSAVVSNGSGRATSQNALLGVTVPGDYAQTVLADAPIHYYRFEETATSQPAADLGTPGGRNGIFTGGITLGQATAPLELGRAARFNGAPGTFVNLGNFHPGNSTTVEAWVQLDPTAANNPGYYAIVARWDGSYELDFAPGDVPNLVVKNQANAFGLVAAPAPLARGQWHHLVGVYDAGVMTLYLNGAFASSVPFAGTLRNGGPVPDRVLIGATRDGSNSSFQWKGLIDEVAIYNRALSADRVMAHYQAALPASRLTITGTGEISWPTLPAGYVLQVTDSLAAPVQWQPADITGRTEENGFFKLSVSPLEGTRFYRLARP